MLSKGLTLLYPLLILSKIHLSVLYEPVVDYDTNISGKDISVCLSALSLYCFLIY